MALEPSAGLSSISPSSSGRASPISRQWGSQRGEEESHSKDKAFRRYASSVERSLSLFETALEEWADYISFIGRLLKSLQSHPPNILVVPSKGLVARRLAQCMNPTLPSGVHQKALEVYNYIFSMVGSDALSRDLPIYLPGLSATLSFASLTVRSPFLALLETHFLKLNPHAIRPALKAIILSLLPGLEEETSEDFERTLKLLNGFRNSVKFPSKDAGESDHNAGDEFFWQCFFLATITSHNRRLGALAYMTRYLPMLAASLRRGSVNLNGNGTDDTSTISDHAADVVTSPEPGLLVRCFAAGLADDQLLIQRGFLDLLVTHLPLHASVLQKRVKREDLELLLSATTGVVIRRDMSLNRRLWAWLLGPEPTSGGDGDGGMESPSSVIADPLNTIIASRTRYFEEYGLQPLISAILKMISGDFSRPGDRAKPFRICLSLMDRWEIGGIIVPEIFLPVVSSVRTYQSKAASRADFAEVLRSASVFFDGVESGLIWAEIINLITSALTSSEDTKEERLSKLDLVRFILENFNVREEEMLMVHIPMATLMLLSNLEESDAPAHSEPPLLEPEKNTISMIAMDLALDLIELIPDRAFLSKSSTRTLSQDLRDKYSEREIREKITRFYVQEQGNLDIAPPPFSPCETCDLLHHQSVRIISHSQAVSVSRFDLLLATRVLVTLLVKSPEVSGLNCQKILATMHGQLSKSGSSSFSIFTALISLATTLYPRYFTVEQMSGLIEPLVCFAWAYLSPSQPKYHVEAVRALWQLQVSLSTANHEIEAAICSIMIGQDTSGTFAMRDADPGRRFCILWTHTLQDNSSYLDRRSSKPINGEPRVNVQPLAARDYEIMLSRPLFLMLDALLDERTQLFVTVRTWIQSLVGVEKLFHIFLSKISDFKFLQNTRFDGLSDGQEVIYTDDDDLDQLLYYLQKLAHIFRWSSEATWAALASKTIPDEEKYSGLMPRSVEGDVSIQLFLVHVCLRTIRGECSPQGSHLGLRIGQLHRTALSVLHQILVNRHSSYLWELHLEDQLLERLEASLHGSDPLIQASLLDVLFAALKLRHVEANKGAPLAPPQHRRVSSQDTHNESSLSLNLASVVQSPPPPALVKCLQAGLASPSSRPVLDNWMNFLAECLPFYSDNIFQILIPLVETLCGQIGQTFASLQEIFKNTPAAKNDSLAPESTLISLLNGLEQLLARGHERLVIDEAKIPVIKSPDQQSGFFGNMVSGVFSSDSYQTRTQSANNRLTVLLSFQDAVRMCFMIWSWGSRASGISGQDADSLASFNYTSLRMRNRARRLLEHLFAAETLECLETVAEIWRRGSKGVDPDQYTAVFNLLHVLDGSRPKHTIPAIFDALYSRTNPSALDAGRKSTLTSDLLDTDLVVFLVEYARSLEDDTMDEIWMDCMTFLKDILANPFPHRQTLPSLLEFTAILGEKVDNTNFGEQRKMRRELGDLFLRLLTATFTTKPISFSESTSQQSASEKSSEQEESWSLHPSNKSEDVVGILASIAPKLPQILVEPDRILNAATIISNSVIGPTFRSRVYPENISKNLLVLLYQLSRLPNTQKTWKKDLGDAFGDPRFFANPLNLVESDWLPLLRVWALSDKDRMPDLLSRISAPTTAGIVFGVGATSARLEADRKTQLNLRRVATLILAAADDSYVTELPAIEEKLVELLNATTTSSPSSTTRAEIYLVLRALVIKTSPIHLGFLWPTINAELYTALSSVIAPDHSSTSETYNNHSILQACKLLDTLLCVAPDDFQLHEWLFISDTIDAVYRPPNYTPVALIEELSEELGPTNITSASIMEQHNTVVRSSDKSIRRPLLCSGGIDCDSVNLERKDDLVGKVLRPFFGQLSIFAFESTYEMGKTDWETCRKLALADVFDERGIVKAL